MFQLLQTEKKWPINHKDDEGLCCFIYSARGGSLEMCKILSQLGINANNETEGKCRKILAFWTRSDEEMDFIYIARRILI